MSATSTTSTLTAVFADLLAGRDLGAAEAETLMGHIMAGQLDHARLGAVLAALRLKGTTAVELGGFARAMRQRAVPVVARAAAGAVDTCGTGGDGRGTFNISTGAALVTAAAGVPVAKHGNRAASSRCGSADVLEALGVTLDLEPDALGRLLDEVGLAFLFAPRHHPAMRHAMPVRKALGVRTVFNLLGPLTNPAGVRHQLLGVYDPALCDLMAGALAELGTRRALVVHGHDGQDELALTGPTRVCELRDGEVIGHEITPESVGLGRCTMDDLDGGHDAATGAALLRAALAGEPGPRTDAVLLNAAGALLAAGAVADLREGVAAAREAVADGRAVRLLERLVAATADLAGSAPRPDEATPRDGEPAAGSAPPAAGPSPRVAGGGA
jgi:anthranilate phosphoribosyltransferase